MDKIDLSNCLVNRKIVGVLEQYQLFSNVLPSIKNILSEAKKHEWFSLTLWLNMQKLIIKQFGCATLFFIGQRTLHNAIWPDDILDMEQALESIDLAYKMTHKNGDIGYYSYRHVSDNRFEIVCVTPYSNYFNIGLIRGIIDHFRKFNLWTWISYDEEDISCEKRYEDFYKLKITIDLMDEKDYTERLSSYTKSDIWINDTHQITDKILQELIWTFDVVTSDLSLKSMTDALTGLYNRYYFKQILRDKVDYFYRYENNMSIIFADIDFFKNINDTYGHIAGDEVLKEVSKILRKNTRKSDIITRWGGEEFVILLFNTPEEQARNIAININKKVQTQKYKKVDENITISMGVASVKANDTAESWFQRADDALYLAKKSGRNQVCVF